MSLVQLYISGIVLLCLTAWFFYITRSGGEIDSRGVYSRLHRAWRRLAFWAGDVRTLGSFPWLTWASHDYSVSYEVWLEAIKHARAGDVCLATKNGFIISNSAIPGVFKHAMIFTQSPTCIEVGARVLCDVSDARIVEAISEGVEEHHPLHARGDSIIILRPRGACEEEIERAVERARRIVGCDYDAGFNFDIEAELAELDRGQRVAAAIPVGEHIERQMQEAKKELQIATVNVQAEYDIAFSCTEVVAMCWWHLRDRLRIYRSKLRGRMVICADQFVNHGFEIVWTNVSAESAAANGMHEEGVRMLDEYWSTRAHG